jgi:hypothetical protein
MIGETLKHAKDYGFDINVQGFNYQFLKEKREKYVNR